MERRSLGQYLEDFLVRGSDCAYVERRGYRTLKWSYREVAELAFRFSRELESRNIAKGDRVLIWGKNSAEWVAAFFGCAVRGVVVVPMDHAAAPEFAMRVWQQVGAKLLVCAREHAQEGLPLLVLEDLPEVVAHHSAGRVPGTEIGPTDTLQVIFTSGTTAEPKGVVISHGNVLTNVAPLEEEIRKYLSREKWFHPVRFLNLLPLSHVFGQFLGIFLPQIMGGIVVFQESLKPSEIISTISRMRISVLVSVPRVLQSLKEKIERDLEDSGKKRQFDRRYGVAEGKKFLRRAWIARKIHWKFGWKFWAFISGGAALDSPTEEFWSRLGYAVIQGYGLTETTSLISVNHPFRLGKGSIGKVLGGREVKLSPDGEILVRGGGVASGYWSGQGIKPVADDEGWYPTGDLGELDADGNLYFKGRKKDVIVTPAGMNIYPEDLETALRKQSEIKDCVVVSLPREGNAEPCAVIILRDAQVDPKAVVDAANKELAEFQRIREWMVWQEEDFPRTSTQKPRRNVIQQAVLGQGKAATGASGLGELIGRITGKNPGQLSADSDLEGDLNLSSLDRVELLGALEDRYQVDLSEAGFASVQTVADVERLLHGQIKQRITFHYPRWVLHWPVTWIRVFAHYLLVRPAVYILGWPKISGKENLRGVRGPVLVISNHVSHTDVGFIRTALPARFGHHLATAAGGEALEARHTPPKSDAFFSKLVDRAIWWFGASLINVFPLPRGAGFRESFAYAGQCVDRGYSVLIFPEGLHTTDGKMNPFRAGIGLLVNNLKIPVVPIRIDGLFEVKQAGKKSAPRGQIKLRIGQPLQLPPDEDPEKIAQQLQKVIEEMRQ